MRRLITLLTACVVLLGALTSCDLNKDYSFTYANKVAVRIADKEDFDAVSEYLKTNYVEKDDPTTFFGKYDDAFNVFLQHFVEVQATVDETFIREHLKDDTDFVQLVGYMCCKDGESWVGFRTWTKNDPTQTGGEGAQ